MHVVVICPACIFSTFNYPEIILIVKLPLFVVSHQEIICFSRFNELLLGSGSTVYVGMVQAGLIPVGFLNVLKRGIQGDAKYVVVF